MPDIWLLYSTFPTRDEAISAAKALLDARLVACANIQERVTSLYRWEGALHQENESVMIAKTSAARVEAATAKIKALHSYDTPCVVAWQAGGGHAPFLEWIAEETAP